MGRRHLMGLHLNKAHWYSPVSVFIWIFISFLFLGFREQISTWLIAEYQPLIVALLSTNLFVAIFERYAFLVVRMQKKGTFLSFQRLLQSILNVVFILSYCHFIAKDFYALIFASVFSLLITTIISIFVERKFWFQSISISKIEISKIFKYGIPFAPACLISILFEGMDKMFLRVFTNFNEMGLYAAGFKIVALLNIIQVGFAVFWTPVSFEHYEKHPEDTSLYERTFKYMSFILILLGLLIITFKDVIILLFAQNYREASTIVPLLLFIPIMYILTEITCLGVYFKKKSAWQLLIFAALLLLGILFNFTFIPWLGAKGAAVAVALAYCAYFYIRTGVSIRLYPMDFMLIKTTLAFFMFFIVAGINTFVPDRNIGIICSIIAIVLYSIFHIPLIKEIVVYSKQIVIESLPKRNE